MQSGSLFRLLMIGCVGEVARSERNRGVVTAAQCKLAPTVMVMAMVRVARARWATPTPIALTQAAAPEAGPYRAASVSHIADTEYFHSLITAVRLGPMPTPPIDCAALP